MFDNVKVVAYELNYDNSSADVAKTLFEHWKLAKKEYNACLNGYNALNRKKNLTEQEEENKMFLYINYNMLANTIEYIWSIAFELNEIEGAAFQEMVYKYQRTYGI